MDRLTRRMCGGWGVVEGCELNTVRGMWRVVERLAAYENTKLTPEEITELKSIKNWADAVEHELDKFTQLEKDGQLVTLPQIKKYKTLYWLWGNEIMPVRFWGISGECVSNGKFHVKCKMRTKRDRTFRHDGKDYTYKAGETRYFYADAIGKTIFFTRKDAEAALKEQEG